MKCSIFIFFLCLSLWTGRELAAQNPQDTLRATNPESYNIAAPKISDDGKWMVVRKRSWVPATEMKDLDADTVMIFSITEKPEIVEYRQNVRQILFVGNSHLLLGKGQEMEFIDLNTRKSRVFKNVKSINVLNDKTRFVLLYDEKGNNMLEVRNAQGKLLNRLKSVNRFYTSETDHVYAITRNKKKDYSLILLKDGSKRALYRSQREITHLNIDPKEHGVMIYEQNQEGPYQHIRYLNLKSNTVFSLEDVLPIQIERGFREVVQEGESYFLRLWVPKKEDIAIVDIWYGNDNALEKKFYAPRKEVHYLWFPNKKEISRIGSNTFTKNVNLGNDRYFLSVNPFLLKDYTKQTPLQINIYDRLKNSCSVMDTIFQYCHVSPNGKYLLYKKNGAWYNYNLMSKVRKIIEGKQLGAPYFSSDGKMALFSGNGKLWNYNPVNNNLDILENFNGCRATILNAFYSRNFVGVPCDQKLIDRQKPLIIKLHDSTENGNSYILWQEKIYDTIVSLTQNYVRDFNYNTSYRCFGYIEENYNLPPQLVFKKIGEKKKMLYQSNKNDIGIKQEIIEYTNKEGTELKGVLYYPLCHNIEKKYPMIVHIYEEQHDLRNRYPYPSYYNGDGFNIRLFLENGYFVYLPDIKIIEKEGPGTSALACVNNALNALSDKTSIDKQKIGLIGHSFGGYETNFIATHSNRFAAYVAGSGIGNLTQMYFSFNYAFNFPDYYRVETLQFDFKTAFANEKRLFFKNNPVYYAENTSAPVLIWAGLADTNVPSSQSMAMYTALRRYHKPVMALFYKNEAHSLQNKKAQLDLTHRIMDWFDYFLKNLRNCKWIEKGLEIGIGKDAP